MSLNLGKENETTQEYIQRLKDNVGILTYDIKELQDIADRYSAKYCLSHQLRQVSWHARQALETLTKKRDLIQDNLDALTKKHEIYKDVEFEDDGLQDYREVMS